MSGNRFTHPVGIELLDADIRPAFPTFFLQILEQNQRLESSGIGDNWLPHFPGSLADLMFISNHVQFRVQ